MLPTGGAERKALPMYSGLIVYFPDALAAVAELSREGNDQHNPGQPLHWARDKSSDHKDCIIRHMTDIAGGADEYKELRAVAWRALAALQLVIEAKGVKSGTTGQTATAETAPIQGSSYLRAAFSPPSPRTGPKGDVV